VSPGSFGAPGKYDALERYLKALPADHVRVVLTLTEIETLIGTPLPLGALAPQYWINGSKTRSVWKAAGFSARLPRLTRTVEFRRRTARMLARRV